MGKLIKDIIPNEKHLLENECVFVFWIVFSFVNFNSV